MKALLVHPLIEYEEIARSHQSTVDLKGSLMGPRYAIRYSRMLQASLVIGEVLAPLNFGIGVTRILVLPAIDAMLETSSKVGSLLLVSNPKAREIWRWTELVFLRLTIFQVAVLCEIQVLIVDCRQLEVGPYVQHLIDGF